MKSSTVSPLFGHGTCGSVAISIWSSRSQVRHNNTGKLGQSGRYGADPRLFCRVMPLLDETICGIFGCLLDKICGFSADNAEDDFYGPKVLIG